MASDEIMTVYSIDTGEHNYIDGYDDPQPDSYPISTDHLVFFNNNDGNDDDDDRNTVTRLSRLCIENSDGDADGELSDEKEAKASPYDSDKEAADGSGFASLPDTPVRASRRGSSRPMWIKEYASETEARVRVGGKRRSRGLRRTRERGLEQAWETRRCKVTESVETGTCPSLDAECRVLVRPRGGIGCMGMDMEEVKACRDLGLELPCDWTVEIPSGISGSTVDTSSGGNSPIGNWRISSPGDDPKDVKARLKVWAQAVALASASRLSS